MFVKGRYFMFDEFKYRVSRFDKACAEVVALCMVDGFKYRFEVKYLEQCDVEFI
jgi:hypothetical protein